MTPLCLGCNEPLIDRRPQTQTCSNVCRQRVFRARQARLSRLVLAQLDAINHADFRRLERLLDEARRIGPLS